MSSLIGRTINGKLITKDTPNEVWEGEFNCAKLQLTSLEGCPSEVGGYFTCGHNKLTSLHGGPIKVGGNYSCSKNFIVNLEGSPLEVGGDFYCHNNSLTSLQNVHLHIQKIGGHFGLGTIWAGQNPIKSHVLGVLLIDGCDNIRMGHEQVEGILNKYLAGSRDIFDCQYELIEAGFEEYAQL